MTNPTSYESRHLLSDANSDSDYDHVETGQAGIVYTNSLRASQKKHEQSQKQQKNQKQWCCTPLGVATMGGVIVGFGGIIALLLIIFSRGEEGVSVRDAGRQEEQQNNNESNDVNGNGNKLVFSNEIMPITLSEANSNLKQMSKEILINCYPKYFAEVISQQGWAWDSDARYKSIRSKLKSAIEKGSQDLQIAQSLQQSGVDSDAGAKGNGNSDKNGARC